MTGSLPTVPTPGPASTPTPTVDGLRPTTVPPRPLAAVAERLGVPLPAGSGQVPVTGVCLDSGGVCPGDLYVGLRGSRTHGARHAGQAAERGAAAVLTDPDGEPDAAAAGLPVLVVADPRGVLGALAGWVYGEPAERLLMLGVTGTNGKTTTTFLLESALRATGYGSGLVGTVEVRAGDLRLASVRTTPEAPQLHALLAVMLERGARACSMEVSSHALALHRVDGVVFDVAGFTNLSQDHLDFHGSMEEYFTTKAGLFTPQRSRRGVVCVDDAWGRRLAAEAGVPVQTLATTPGAAGGADWLAVAQADDLDGTRFTLRGPDGVSVSARSPIPGGFNVANSALCLVMLAVAGIDPARAAAALAGAGSVPGRMERVAGAGAPGEPVGIVDYAHGPQAVGLALAALRPATPGRLVAVLGAGGDRDRDKRPLMGAAAAREADVVVVTDDNPRSEDPAAIRAAVLAGARSVDGRAARVVEIADRRAAVAEAVRLAWGEPRGAVLVAGKGHEQGQEVGGEVWPFDDRRVLREALLAAAGGPGPAGTAAATGAAGERGR